MGGVVTKKRFLLWRVPYVLQSAIPNHKVEVGGKDRFNVMHIFSLRITLDNVDQPVLLEAIIKSIEDILVKTNSVTVCY